jgi:hypothetical protein
MQKRPQTGLTTNSGSNFNGPPPTVTLSCAARAREEIVTDNKVMKAVEVNMAREITRCVSNKSQRSQGRRPWGECRKVDAQRREGEEIEGVGDETFCLGFSV